ncbi:hypothetical protein MLD38_024232 [Melastoma candidum]|uniref:Uncharacterized protein n=1 Tax=Melastoma candidum TaxID=119954 RepID=A0ACB9NSZ6_9MYRT|nr:hypothetical protein MLD38_024232 [Melastoma candidum]
MDFRELDYYHVAIVIKGHVCTASSCFAKELAKNIRCPLLSYRDVFSCVSASPDLFSSLAADEHHAVSFSNGIFWRLVSANISGRASGSRTTVIDLLLPQQLHLDQVLETNTIVQISQKVFLIDCRPGDDESYRITAENMLDDLPHLVVDISDLLKTVEDLVTDVGKCILSWLRDSTTTERPEREVKDDYEQDWRNEIWPVFGHCHPLAMSDAHTCSDNPDDKISCRLCLEDVSGPAHGCSECGFYLHKSCSELPSQLAFLHHDHEVISLHHIPPQSRGCILCRSSSGVLYKCNDCFAQLHPECTNLPVVIKHSCHEHVLNFYIYPFMPVWRIRYICHACGNYGSAASYFCKECRLHLHVDCALRLERSVQHKRHWHPLILSPPPTDETHEYYCEVCAAPRHESLWIYMCAECEFKYEAHVSCINPDVPRCHPDVYLPENKTDEQLKRLNGEVYDDIDNVPGELGPKLAEIPAAQAAWTAIDDYGNMNSAESNGN